MFVEIDTFFCYQLYLVLVFELFSPPTFNTTQRRRTTAKMENVAVEDQQEKELLDVVVTTVEIEQTSAISVPVCSSLSGIVVELVVSSGVHSYCIHRQLGDFLNILNRYMEKRHQVCKRDGEDGIKSSFPLKETDVDTSEAAQEAEEKVPVEKSQSQESQRQESSLRAKIPDFPPRNARHDAALAKWSVEINGFLLCE